MQNDESLFESFSQVYVPEKSGSSMTPQEQPQLAHLPMFSATSLKRLLLNKHSLALRGRV